MVLSIPSKVKECVYNKATVSVPAESFWHKWENKDLKWLLFTQYYVEAMAQLTQECRSGLKPEL